MMEEEIHVDRILSKKQMRKEDIKLQYITPDSANEWTCSLKCLGQIMYLVFSSKNHIRLHKRKLVIRFDKINWITYN